MLSATLLNVKVLCSLCSLSLSGLPCLGLNSCRWQPSPSSLTCPCLSLTDRFMDLLSTKQLGLSVSQVYLHLKTSNILLFNSQLLTPSTPNSLFPPLLQLAHKFMPTSISNPCIYPQLHRSGDASSFLSLELFSS